jgi:hypothetical protein
MFQFLTPLVIDMSNVLVNAPPILTGFPDRPVHIYKIFDGNLIADVSPSLTSQNVILYSSLKRYSQITVQAFDESFVYIPIGFKTSDNVVRTSAYIESNTTVTNLPPPPVSYTITPSPINGENITYSVTSSSNDMNALLLINNLLYQDLSISGPMFTYNFNNRDVIAITKSGINQTMVINGISTTEFIIGETLVSKPIEVNLNVIIDASGELQVFGGPAADISGEIIVAEYNLPVSCFYTGSVDTSGNVTDASGLIEVWEPSDNLGKIYCSLAQNIQNTQGDYYKDTAKKLAEELQTMFCSPFDASGATPFNVYKDSDPNGNYWKPAHFGRLVLSAHAYDMFGHVAATAAITNDVAFMQNMLDVSGGIQPSLTVEDVNPKGRTDSYRYSAQRANGVHDVSWKVASNASANLALRMARAIVANGLNGEEVVPFQDVSSAGLRDPSLAAIVKQVVGQDASRLRTVDNNELTPDRHQTLRFYTGDVVYMNVRIEKPNVVFNGNKATQLDDTIGARNYAIKVTLA